MTTWIALLRGVNVGGRNRLAMAELRQLFADGGCGEVRTYVQSGNVLFGADVEDRGDLAHRLATAIETAKGFRPAVLLLTRDELVQAMADNPFPDATSAPTTLHLFFLLRAPVDPDLAALDAARAASERCALRDRVFYLWAPDGIGRSKLAAKAERAIGVEATARNWRTLTHLQELTEP
jgi:uncharacterized protein (DUF1697 family)